MCLLANSDESFHISLDKGAVSLVTFSCIFCKCCGFEPPFLLLCVCVHLFVRKSVYASSTHYLFFTNT